MNKTDILSALDEEISRLRQARDLLADASLPTRSEGAAKTVSASAASEPVVKRGPGRPKGSVSKSKADAAPAKKASKAASVEAKEPAPKRRTMSAEGKARIAAAQRERWARQHGEAASKAAPAKKTASKKTAGKSIASKTAGATKAAKKAAPVKAAKTVKKAPVKLRGPYKKSASKSATKPAADAGAQTGTTAAGE